MFHVEHRLRHRISYTPRLCYGLYGLGRLGEHEAKQVYLIRLGRRSWDKQTL